MFRDNLSEAILRICEEFDYSYAHAAELCSLSPRYLQKIISRRCTPTIAVLENMCNGFDRTPNELLGYPLLEKEMSYRREMPVVKSDCFFSGGERLYLPVCPRCGKPIIDKHQSYCCFCGQALSWKKFSPSNIIRMP